MEIKAGRDFEAQAQLIDQSSDTVTYLGCPKEDGADPLCAIMKIEEVDGVTTKKWANGSWEQKTLWSDRATATYKFM